MDFSPALVIDAAKLAEEYREFTYRVSHDLGAPVRGMVEFSRLLKSDHAASLDEEGQLFLSLIVESGEKLQRMMSGLVAYSRLDTLVPHPTPIDCSVLIGDCVKQLDPLIREKNALIRIEPLPVIESDSEMLHQLFTILLENALLFHLPGHTPTVTVRAETAEESTAIIFKDNGIGIPENLRPKLFKPFARLHGEQDYPGIGMGLALVTKIVRNLGGGVSILGSESGTAIRLVLPRAAA